MTPAKMKPCTHPAPLLRLDDGSLECRLCAQTWVPSQVAEAAQAAADMAAGTAAAMLWDFHERAVEKYGAEVAQTVAPDAVTGGYAYTPDTCPGHAWQQSVCVHCGSSQFLGGE